MTYLKFLTLPFLLSFTLAACETIEGAGRDIEAAGEAVTESAQDAK